ncbi:chemotaxis protein CheB [Archangium primigenium]|uniref:chemotaxis protein CheB n=1 Tax=[Archangium] primigenium TaxID=2792470 RepID=UPI00195CC531|nr:chemotaxis protein CheB [Archangium primigenium]MBM7119364.1 chemotaxis protein CheB [Archangium primigenium]
MAHHRDIVVIGASAGGVEALSTLVTQLPADFPAAVLIVLHVASGHRSMLPQILSRVGPLTAVHPQDGEPLEPGRIYVAPNDRHLVVEPGRVRLLHGPRENNHRPAVDTLFRSAAVAYGPRVVGVVLTGALDCGTAGLMAVKHRGGLAVVQDPRDAFCPDMPRSAMEFVKVDHCVPLAELGALLVRLAATKVVPSEAPPPSPRLKEEVKAMAGGENVGSDPKAVGSPSYYSCPDCGGVLFEMDEAGWLHYRCRVGHGYTARSLSVQQQTALDGAMWAALRALEESASLSRRMARNARERHHELTAQRYEERAKAAEEQAELVRQVVLALPTAPLPESGTVEPEKPGRGEAD